MVSTRSIDETSRRRCVSARFRERVAGDEPRGGLASSMQSALLAVRPPRQTSSGQSIDGLEALPFASPPREARHQLSDFHGCCDIATQARRRTCATSVLNVFVASVALRALPICLLARSEMRCYICDRSGSPLPRRAWQRKAPGHPTSAPFSRGGLHRRRCSARAWRYRGVDSVRFTVAGVCQWRPSPRAVPASREARSTKSS